MADKTPEEKAAILAADQAKEIERLQLELEKAKASAPAVPAEGEGAKDETVEGGVYIVGGVKVNADGEPINK